MIIIEGKHGTGKSTELIKRFLQEDSHSVLLTDELTLSSIHNIIKKLKEDGYKINNEYPKIIKTLQYTSCNADYFEILTREGIANVYVDINFSNSLFYKLKPFCLELEKEYGYEFTFISQLTKSSNINNLNIIKFDKYL